LTIHGGIGDGFQNLLRDLHGGGRPPVLCTHTI
jgi:hypothetical protein